MTIKPQKIDTAADLLMTLLQNVKEISLADAAKTLGVPVATLENWSTFLEEEQLLQIKYKFTTPYLSLVNKDKKAPHFENFERKLPPDEINEEIQKIDESMGKIEDEVKRGDFSTVKGLVGSMFMSIRTLKDNIKLDPSQKVSFEKKINEIESLIEKANSYTETSRFDLANKLYTEADEEIKTITLAMKRAYFESKKEPERFNDPKQILDKAYSLMKEGKTDESRETYEKLKDVYNSLPGEFAERRSEMERSLVKLNKDLSMTMDRQSVQSMKQGIKKINDLVKNARDATNKNDFEKAEEIYYEIKKSFESLPEGFIKERRDLESQILGLFETISIKRKELITKAINSKISEVKVLIKSINDGITAGRIEESIKHYAKAKKVFEELPAEFINERLFIHQLLLPAYQNLYRLYISKSQREIKEKLESVKKMLDTMKAQSDANNIKAAEETYEGVKAEFSKMPAGFVNEKIDLQNAIIDTYQYMLSKSENQAHKILLERSLDIQKLVNEGCSYIKSGKVELAEEIYKHAVNAYNNLPPGFVYEKAVMRQKILNLYREVMLNSDVKLLKANHPDVNEKYKEILKLLINARHNIDTRNFELLEPEYHKIRKIFNELPVGFIQEKLKLRESIISLAEEVDFFRKICLAEKAAQEKNPELKDIMAEIEKIKEKIDKPENRQLIDYFEEKKRNFNDFLSKTVHEEPKIEAGSGNTFDELHEKISQLRACAAPAVRMPVLRQT